MSHLFHRPNPLDLPTCHQRRTEACFEESEALPVVKALFEARLAWGLTQETVAHRIGCHVATLRHMEAGRKDPSGKLLLQWADVLGFELCLRSKPLEGR